MADDKYTCQSNIYGKRYITHSTRLPIVRITMHIAISTLIQEKFVSKNKSPRLHEGYVKGQNLNWESSISNL